MLQPKAGYIDARPHIRQFEEVLLTARPDHTLGQIRSLERCPLHDRSSPKAEVHPRSCYVPNVPIVPEVVSV